MSDVAQRRRSAHRARRRGELPPVTERRYAGIAATILGAQSPAWCQWRAKGDWGRAFLVPARREVYRYNRSVTLPAAVFDRLVEAVASPAPCPQATIRWLKGYLGHLSPLWIGVSERYSVLTTLHNPPPVVRYNPRPDERWPPHPNQHYPDAWKRTDNRKEAFGDRLL